MKKKSDYKNIIIFLSMRPEDGGKFQYSLSIVNSLSSICSDKYKITAALYNNDWIKYIPGNIMLKSILRIFLKIYV